MVIAGAWGLLTFIHGSTIVIGQRSEWVAPWVYAPPQLWIGLHAILFVMACVMSRWLVLLCALGLWGAVHPLLHEGSPKPVTHDASELRVVTCNWGQIGGHRLEPFIEHVGADIVALQESYGARAATPSPAMKMHQRRVGEFILLSRYPITRTELLFLKGNGKLWPRAVRFEVQWPTHPLVVYSVHLPSPRHELKDYRRSLTPGQTAQQFWQAQEGLLQDVMQRMEAETLPVVVLGDWNVPPIGPLYRRLTERFLDAHQEAGSGPGFTFPGDVRNPLSMGGRWLRLDYVLANGAWEILHCETEGPSGSQHSAVGAVLRLR